MQKPDPFFDQMFARMSPGAEYLFSPYQLDEIKKAFGARSFGCHAVDVRSSVRMFRSSYYVLVLAGRERRLANMPRINAPSLSSMIGALLAAVLFLLLGG